MRSCPGCSEIGAWTINCIGCSRRYCSSRCFGTAEHPPSDNAEVRVCPDCQDTWPQYKPDTDSHPRSSQDEPLQSADMSASMSSSTATSYYNMFLATWSYDSTRDDDSMNNNAFISMMNEMNITHDPEHDDLQHTVTHHGAGTFLHGCFSQTGKEYNKVFTSVQGVQQAGLLIDPGASRALIGMDSLKKIVDEVLRPRGLMGQMTWSRSAATFQGINPTAERSLGLVTIPIGLAGMRDCVFRADVIGGVSSLCPGLVPLRTLSALHAVILCGWYPDGDGVLGLWQGGAWKAQHLYKTDSGHYLLRIDEYTGPKTASRYVGQGAVLRTVGEMLRTVPPNASHKSSTSATQLHTSSVKSPPGLNQGAWKSTDSTGKTVFH